MRFFNKINYKPDFKILIFTLINQSFIIKLLKMPLKKFTQEEFDSYSRSFTERQHNVDRDLMILLIHDNPLDEIHLDIHGKTFREVQMGKEIPEICAVEYWNYVNGKINTKSFIKVLTRYCSHPEILLVNTKLWCDLVTTYNVWEAFEQVQGNGYEIGDEDDEFEDLLSKSECEVNPLIRP